MAVLVVPHFQNDTGVERIEVGVKEFKCIGALPPFDHPHIFIDMGDADEAVCGYCATIYRFNPDLAPDETIPPGHLLSELSPT